MKIETRIKLPLHSFPLGKTYRTARRMTNPSTDLDLAAANAELEALNARERIAWAAERFKDGLVMSSSFGLQSAVLLHLANKVVPGIPVVFVDTGYLFKETYNYADRLQKLLDLNLKVYTSPLTPARHEALHGQQWKQGTEGFEKYGLIRKVEPMDRAVKELGATLWLTGLRRQQSSTRRHLTIIERPNRTLKLHSIVDWEDSEVETYLLANDLPRHPLAEKGYVKLGDVHSTVIPAPGQHQEAARPLKYECGLHDVRSSSDQKPGQQFEI